MSVPEQNMRTLMGWLNDDAAGATQGAEEVTEDLATLVFLGDVEWPNYEDRAGRYAQDISAWLTGGTESEFIARTEEGGDLAAFISWMMPVLEQWKASAAQDEAGQEGQGLSNPNYESDPTPDTQYYRYDEATGEYLYSATADGADWATYDQRRYSEPTMDDNYGLNYRYDKRDEIYEWYDEPNGTWNDQAWADQYAASGSAQAAAAGAGSQAASAAAWDENWQMFYRIGPGGAYEYADAVVPGDESSGSSEIWLSHEQVMTRATPEQAAEPNSVSTADAPSRETVQVATKVFAGIEKAFGGVEPDVLWPETLEAVNALRQMSKEELDELLAHA
jgi:hypothetical protein